MPLTISRLSVEYVRVPVKATDSGAAIDPTNDTVALAFTAIGSQPVTWHVGTWETDSSSTPAKHYARLVVGPGFVVLAPGRWRVWVKVTDNPEIPVLETGDLTIS